MNEGFTIKSDTGDFLTLTLTEVFDFPDKTCAWGGYDARAELTLKAGGFQVKSAFYTTTGEIFSFYQQLKDCNSKLKGSAIYDSYEANLKFTASYDDMGHITIHGDFSENLITVNKLTFAFGSDQSFIKYTLDDLTSLVAKYGDLKGVNK